MDILLILTVGPLCLLTIVLLAQNPQAYYGALRYLQYPIVCSQWFKRLTGIVHVPGLSKPMLVADAWPFEQVIYINLPDAQRRRQRCQMMLPLWFHYRLIKRLGATTKQEVMDEEYRNRWRGRLQDSLRRGVGEPANIALGNLKEKGQGVLACWFSHLEALKEVQGSGKTTLIVEDDISLLNYNHLTSLFGDQKFWLSLPEDWAILRPNILRVKAGDRIGTSPWYRPTPIVPHLEDPERDPELLEIWEYYFSTAFNIIHPERIAQILAALETTPIGNMDQATATMPGVYYFDCDFSIKGDNFTENFKYS